jgi:hypothetical protein
MRHDFEHYVVSVISAFMTIFLVVMFWPIAVFAQDVVPVDVPVVDQFWTAIVSQNWPLAFGFGLTIVVWIGRRFVIKKIPKKALPWITLALAVFGTAGTRIIQFSSETRPWWQGLVQGAIEGTLIGLTAMGVWDIKQTKGKKKS